MWASEKTNRFHLRTIRCINEMSLLLCFAFIKLNNFSLIFSFFISGRFSFISKSIALVRSNCHMWIESFHTTNEPKTYDKWSIVTRPYKAQLSLIRQTGSCPTNRVISQPFQDWKSIKLADTMANSEDRYEMPHDAAFSSGSALFY